MPPGLVEAWEKQQTGSLGGRQGSISVVNSGVQEETPVCKGKTKWHGLPTLSVGLFLTLQARGGTYAIAYNTDPSSSNHCRKGPSSSCLARPTLLLNLQRNGLISPCPVSLATACRSLGSRGLQWKKVWSTSLQWLCVKGSRLVVMCGNGDAAKNNAGGTDTIQSIADGRGGGIQTRSDSEEEKWREEVNRQCHSRNRTKYIYINSLL